MTPTEIAVVLANYRLLTNQLYDYARKNFPIGTAVHVNCTGRYIGRGVSFGIGTSPDTLAVTIPNSNTWDYPLETITKA